MRSPVALIIFSDPLAAALLGAAVELAELSPRFPAPDESPRDALRRLRPALVLVDGSDEAALIATVGPATMSGVRLLVLDPPGATPRAAALVAGSPAVRTSLMSDTADMARTLRAALAG